MLCYVFKCYSESVYVYFLRNRADHSALGPPLKFGPFLGLWFPNLYRTLIIAHLAPDNWEWGTCSRLLCSVTAVRFEPAWHARYHSPPRPSIGSIVACHLLLYVFMLPWSTALLQSTRCEELVKSWFTIFLTLHPNILAFSVQVVICENGQ